MKKTFAALMALAGVAFATPTTIEITSSTTEVLPNGNNDSEFILDVIAGTASITRILPATAGANIKEVTLLVENGNTLSVTGTDGVKLNNKAYTDFTGRITMEDNAKLHVTKDICFNTQNSNKADSTANYSTAGYITLGQGAEISAQSLSFVGNQATENKSLTIAGVFGLEQMSGLTSGSLALGDVVETKLITLTAGVSNLTVDRMMFSDIAAMQDLGYTNVGVITDAAALSAGQYGLVYSTTGFTLTAVATPEPATATLSLLALAGLAARRRRR